jgi:hypothetical protein
MSHQEPAADPLGELRPILKSQYHATLAMLRQAVELCPDELWTSLELTNPYWRVAYHTLYYTHLYLQPTAETFRAWEHHQTNIQHMDDVPAPPEIEALLEPPHRPPQTGEPYTKTEILAYWDLCDAMVDAAVDALDLTSPRSGFPWSGDSKMEHQISSLRHIQHHTAQLSDRLRATAGVGVAWVGARRA